MKKNLMLLLVSGLLLPVFISAQMDARLDYIANYKQIALDEMERVGIPASIKMAQAILESGSGTSTLALQAKNHFGIKCGNNWDGQTMYRKDDDYNSQGKLIASCFRKYDSVSSSFIAHSQFLLANRRYSFLFELDPTDYKGWAKGLKKAGYATSSTYANKLIQIIEEYELYLFDLGIDPTTNDQIVIAEEPTIKEEAEPVAVSYKPRPQGPTTVNSLAIITINDVKNVKAEVGETPETIAARTNVEVKRLIRYNEFLSSPDQIMKGGERIYLQPKRASYRGKKKYHFVKDGEQMIDIAQLYGLRLQKLYEKNRLDPGYEPAKGQKVKIRGGKIPVSQRPKQNWVGNNNPIKVDDFEWQNEADDNLAVDNETYLDAVESPKRNNKSRKNTEIAKPIFSQPKKEIVKDTPVVTQSATTTVRTSPDEIVWDRPNTKPMVEKEILVKESLKSIVEKPRKEVPNRTIPVVSKPAPRVHVVSSGETLYRISKYYGISVAALKAKNDLSENTIKIGQRIIVD